MSFWKHLIENGEASITPTKVQQQMFDKIAFEYRKHCPELSDAFFADFRKCCEVVRFKKGAEIYSYEKGNQHSIVAVRGLIAAKENSGVKERVMWFMGRTNCSVMERSFYMKMQYNYQVVALELSDCIMLPNDKREILIGSYESFEEIVDEELNENLLIQRDQSYYWDLPPINRYQYIYEENPELIISLPDEELAKYLRVDKKVVTQLRNLNKLIGSDHN
ncbi:cyclic nucleotide-binding domain-containing protein [Chitinophaga deserti]|uniref:hypothetical protein n=1 Tax=Chitinophaga deserti TaxID=2164099 RepID=UPI000D6D0EA5|nr:hypothetical protein [Chitinophaga deserti]